MRRGGSSSASPNASTNSDGSPAGTAPDATASSSQAEEKKKIKELKGEGGSILNIFRVLFPGALESRPKVGELPHHPCACAAHDFEAGGWKERCGCGVTEEGRPLRKFEPHSFDTIVDTYGLCSHDDPVQVGG